MCILSKFNTVSISEALGSVAALNKKKKDSGFQNMFSKSPTQLSADAVSSRVERTKCAVTFTLVIMFPISSV